MFLVFGFWFFLTALLGMTDMILIQFHNTIYNINQKYKIQQEQSLTKQSRKKVTNHNFYFFVLKTLQI